MGGGGQVGTVRSGRGLCKEVWEEGVEERLKDTEPGEVRRGWLTPRRGQDRPKPGQEG